MIHRRTLTAALATAALALAGCGGDGGGSKKSAPAPRGPSSQELRDQLAQATRVDTATFPAARGKTLRKIADGLAGTGPQLAPATSVFPAGRPRLAFGLIDQDQRFVYAPTVVYVARGEDKPADGPFPAPADLLVTDPPFRSRTAAGEDDPFAAVYDTRIDAKRPGKYFVLAVSQINGALYGAPSQITVIAPSRDAIPAVSEQPPRIDTDTVESAKGDIESIDTRIPPDDMHATSLAAALGRKPIALLFATPQLCQSRVCGPVVDIALQLKQTYGDRMEFIHQEVYVDNQVDKGLRPPMRRFGLPTEPWLFTIDKSGRVAARLEGSFGFRSFEEAIKAAL